MLGSFGYNLKQGMVQVFRNRTMTLASIFSILAMLLILGIFFVVSVNINLMTEVVKQDYDQVEIFLKESTTRQDAEKIMANLDGKKGVTGVEYRSKKQALNILKERWGDSGYLLDSLGKNPLPASILISVKSLDDAGKIVEFAGKQKGVEDVQFYKETVDKLTKITNFLQISGIVVMIFLVVISVIVVSNTVKLTVFARSKEIKIMKYVGATHWFIRGPFMAEGIIIGVIAAGFATGLVCLIYTKLLEAVGDEIIAIISTPLIPVSYMTMNLAIIFIALGASVGAWGSIISMRKFLNV